jgi:hypothetical protein
VVDLLGARAALLASGISVQLSPREEGGYRLRVALPQGERVLDEASCRDLLAAAALIVASSIAQAEPPAAPPPAVPAEPTQLAMNLTEPTPQAAGVARALAVPQPSLPAIALPVRPDRAQRAEPEPMREDDARPALASPRALRVGVGAGLVWGVLPAVSAGFEALLAARVARLEPALALRYAAPRNIDVADGSVRVQVLSGTLVLAYLPWSFLRVGVGGDAHVLRARGRELSGAAKDWAFTFGPRLESWATLLEAAHGSLLVGAAGLYQVRAARFASAEGELLHAASSWGFQAGVRGAWDFF